MSRNEIDTAQIIKLASEVAAKTALDKFRDEHKRTIEEWRDRRLYNTRLLLENYRALNAHINNAVFEQEKLEDYRQETANEILELMWQTTDSDVIVASIKRSVERTRIIMSHVDMMLSIYKAYCRDSSKPEELRRWRVIEGRYLLKHKKAVWKLAKEEHCSEKTIQRDVNEAIERISSLLFGINGLYSDKTKCREDVLDTSE